MRRFDRKGLIMGGICCLAMSGTAKGQGTAVDFIYGSINDAEQVLQAYLEPLANVLGTDLNAGWYNTARPHELGGIDITLNVSWATAPAELLSYNVSALDLNGEIAMGGPAEAPTVAGSMANRPVISYTRMVDLGGGNLQEIEYASFTLPNGAGLDWFPAPMVQLGVGLVLGTDISVRFLPSLQFRDYGEVGLWGVGGKHSISQWVPGIRELGFLDISVQGGYTKVSASANVDVEPLPGYVEVEPDVNVNWSDQYIDQSVGGWTTNIIASETFSILTLYQGIGYASSLVEMGMRGHYPIHTVIEQGPDTGKLSYDIVEDPISLSFQNINRPRFNVGARIKIGGLTLHYDFTYTLYATHSAGIGVSFR